MRKCWIGVLLSVFLGACTGSESVRCDDGFICPSILACAPNGGCASTIQIATCADKIDGQSCDTGAGQGTCNNGICLGSQCGNGVVDDGEVCDHGDTTSDLQCRSDCRKIEVCGDGEVDEGEACDDDNSNDADGCTKECVETEWVAATLFGGGEVAADTQVLSGGAVFLVENGDLYFSDPSANLVRRLDSSSGLVTTIAGTGNGGFSGDGNSATSAELQTPSGLYVDGLGDVYIADSGNHRVRRVDAITQKIETIAGTGNPGFSGENGAATSADLDTPSGVFVDGLGDVYLADSLNHRIRLISRVDGLISTVAGGGEPSGEDVGDGGDAEDAKLNIPKSVVGHEHDGVIDLYITDSEHNRVRKVNGETGVIETVAGNGLGGSNGVGDGGPATEARLNRPGFVFPQELDGGEVDLYIGDTFMSRIRRVDGKSGQITTVAGTTTGFDITNIGNGGPAISATLRYPQGVFAKKRGDFTDLFIADGGGYGIRFVDGETGLIDNRVGGGEEKKLGDGGFATSADLDLPQGVFVSGSGDTWIADAGQLRVRQIDGGSGTIETSAGTGRFGNLGDLGPAVDASFVRPRDVFVDESGATYIVDQFASVIRRIDGATGIIDTVAGGGTNSVGGIGDGGLATDATLHGATGLFVEQSGEFFDIYISDTANARIRYVDGQTGIINTLIGIAGDEMIYGSLHNPVAVFLDRNGDDVHLYIAGGNKRAIHRADLINGTFETIAGDGTAPSSEDDFEDGGAAIDAKFYFPTDVHVYRTDVSAELFIADPASHRIRKIDLITGIIETVAGDGTSGNFGDGGPAILSRLASPSGVFVDDAGSLYIADTGNKRVRKVNRQTGVITTVAGKVFENDAGPISQGVAAADPRSVVRRNGNWLVAGGSSGVVQEVDLEGGNIVGLMGRYLQDAATSDLARFRDSNFGNIGAIAFDEDRGLIYITETSRNRIHVVTTDDSANGIFPSNSDSWTIAVLGGGGTSNAEPGYLDGPLATSLFKSPEGLFLNDDNGVLYVADTGNHAIRAIDLVVSSVSTMAGTPQNRGFFGDGGPATDALLYEPVAVTECPNGDIFVAEVGSHHVRRVEAGTGIISTVLGVGVPGSSGSGVPSSIFPVDEPRGLACDAYGNLYVTSRTALRLLAPTEPDGRKGVIDGGGSVQTIYQSPEHQCLTAVAMKDVQVVDSPIFLTDSCTGAGIELTRVTQ